MTLTRSFLPQFTSFWDFEIKKFATHSTLSGATTKPRQIERSSFFLLDHNGKTQIYRLVSGSFDVPLRRKRDFPMEYDDYTDF